MASLVVGLVGWLFAARLTDTVSTAMGPVARIVGDLAESIEATEVIVQRTTEAIDSIETATRSSARAVDSAGEVLGEAATLTGGSIADGLDSAVDTLPALVSTGRVIDRTMRTLSLVGVDYDPEVPLDEALADLEASLAPIPGQMREQVELMGAVQDDLAQISADAGRLAAVLLQARIDMMEAERVVASAAESASIAAASVEAIESDIESYGSLAAFVALAVALALLMGATAPLLLGLHLRRDGDMPA